MIRRLLALAVAALLAFPAPLVAAAPLAHPTTFSVTVEGAGPDVIMIPGLMSGRRVWDQTVRSLGGRYRVHRLQIAGFAGEPAAGNAEGPVLDAVVEELHAYIAGHRLQRPRLVGHSAGGLVAMMLLARHPEDAESALIVDALPFYGMLFGADATVASVAPRAAALRDAVAGMSEEAYRAQQPITLAALIRNPDARPAVLEDAMASDRAVVTRMLYEDMVTDMRDSLPRIRARLTVAYAVNEFATEERFGVLMRSGYSGAAGVRFVPVESSYHFIMLDQPERFAAILAEFLAAGAPPGE